jgi:hypothetical protein
MTNAFCTDCGTKLEIASKFCGSCGAAVLQSDHVSALTRVPPPQEQHVASPLQVPVPQAPQQTSIHNTVVMVAPTKSVGVALLLTILFGPLGLFYATVTGGVVMLLVSFIVGLVTLGFGLLITWPICVVWSAIAANSHNAALLASQQQVRQV